MKDRVKILARLYLDKDQAEISETTINDFCDWIMAEFQQLPLAIKASDFMRYETEAEMFADIEQDRL